MGNVKINVCKGIKAYVYLFFMLYDFIQAVDWPSTIAGIVGGTCAGIGAGYITVKLTNAAQKSRDKKAARLRDLLDDNCPVVRTRYDKTSDGLFKQEIRAAVSGGANLRQIFNTHTDLHVGYIHQAAQLAYKSDDPIIFNHLKEVIPSEDYDSVMYDICADMRIYFGPLLEGQQDKYGEKAYPVLVAEKSAHRKQIRIFITKENQVDVNTLPTQDKLLLEVGPNEFEQDPRHDNNAHLATRKRIAEQLTANQTLRRQTFVAVEP